MRIINTHFFLLAKKHILLRIFVKVKAINIKLWSLVSEVSQRLCANFGANGSIGGAINREPSNNMKVDRICMKIGDKNLFQLRY